MADKIIFHKLSKENIFDTSFDNFTFNNEIEFKNLGNNKIAVLYGPNGTGKTSLAKILGSTLEKKEGEFEIEFRGHNYTPENNNIFHIINDQNSRNVIKGNAQDYLMGDNIRKEYELKEYIDSCFIKIFKNELPSKLKEKFGISTMKNKLLEGIRDVYIKACIKDICNTKSKGNSIDRDEFLGKVKGMSWRQEPDFNRIDEEKFNFIINNISDDKSIVSKILTIDINKLTKNEKIREIEESSEALRILHKFSYKDECVVCENIDFDKDNLIKKQTVKNNDGIKSLDEYTKEVLEDIILVMQKKK